VAASLTPDERKQGVSSPRPHWVPFAKGEGFGEYSRPSSVAINWSRESVEELERRAAWPSGRARKTYFRNRDWYFKSGLTYSVVSAGRISARMMGEGWVFGHKGSAIFVEDSATSESFLLGYLNSALATYFMKRIVNTTATADIGYIEKLPYRRPSQEVERGVVERVEQIIKLLKEDPGADIQPLRNEIDDAFFDLFEIGSARDDVRHFYDTVGRVERPDEDQAASESGNE